MMMIPLFWFGALAQQQVQNDHHIVYMNAISTERLSPEVARSFGITRSQNLALLNITVMEKGTGDGLDRPSTGTVTASATNDSGLRRKLEMRTVEKQGTTYYFGLVRVADQETLDFSVQVTVTGSQQPLTANFQQQFFVD